MANQEHLEVLKQGTVKWNEWRQLHSGALVELSRADLSRADLSFANLSRADLSHANLSGANLSYANLSYANLSFANLSLVNLSFANLFHTILNDANLSFANLSFASLSYANLSRADLSRADLSHANLSRAILIHTNFTGASLLDCHIYGISAWSLELKGAVQNNLIITQFNESTITFDNLEIAQFIYLLLNNAKIREFIDTIAKKAVLILGRFTPERKEVLDALRDTLRQHNYLPILFDFESPQNRDVTETIRTLAHLARFILADLTDPSSIPLELEAIVPHLEIPVQPLLLETKKEFSMFASLRKYQWVLPTYTYRDIPSLLASLEHLLASAEQKADELAIEKARRLIEP